MGQLRSAIEALTKKIANIAPEAAKLADAAEESNDRIREIAKSATEGYNVLYLSLVGHFKSKKEKIEDHLKDKIGEAGDPNAKDLAKGIASWNASLKKNIADANREFAAVTSKTLKLIKEASAEAEKLKKIAEKKKNSWLKSKEYKEKAKRYIVALQDAIAILDRQEKAVDDASKATLQDGWVDRNFPVVTSSWTIQQLKDKTSMDFNTQLSKYFADTDKYEKHVRVFRDELKTIPNQLKLLKSWSGEAEEMETEAQEK